MPTLHEVNSNEELHQTLIQRSRDRQREQYIAVLHTRQYPLPVDLLKIVILYLPGYFMHWLPSGELVFKQDLPLAPKPTLYLKEFVPHVFNQYDEFDEFEELEEYDDYEHYEEQYNPEYD